ncbi:MAG: hypothetical protein JO364_01815 [Pseudonocardiales bacterium]|nr:hypothetical protein [Pseudonocardiales bacterium]MBV9029049.1 hypothetical protein [Pseudonocardiales bacterium]
MSPKPSAVSRPELFVDRSLGRSTKARLRQLRWIVHLVNDHFEHDGQFVKDERWIEYGNLTIEQQARMFEEARVHIERAVQRHEARFYQVYEGGRIVKRWP